MKNFIIIILLVIFANFFFLTVGFSQENGLQVQGIVPETDANRNATQQLEQREKKPVFKENTWLYFFQKSQENQDKMLEPKQAQTVYDRVASDGLMVLVMFVVACFLVLVIKGIEKIFVRLKGKKHNYRGL